MKIIFMGTPDFAIPALEALISSTHEIVAVYTKEPKPAGRGYLEIKSKVHELALSAGIPVFTPKNFKGQNEVDAFELLDADVAVVAAYGLILPNSILQKPKHGCINIHPSKLPRWRGAAPLQRTILSGDPDTEICIMQMDAGMDTGDIILRQRFEIPSQMTASGLHDEAAKIGGKLVLQVLQMMESGDVVLQKQSELGVLHAAKVSRAEEVIDWAKTAFEIHCQIRAFSPRPAAHFKYNGEMIKIIAAEFEMTQHSHAPGTVVDDQLTIACGQGFIKPTLLQREGKKMIYKDAFLRGFMIPVNTKL